VGIAKKTSEIFSNSEWQLLFLNIWLTSGVLANWWTCHCSETTNSQKPRNISTYKRIMPGWKFSCQNRGYIQGKENSDPVFWS